MEEEEEEEAKLAKTWESADEEYVIAPYFNYSHIKYF